MEVEHERSRMQSFVIISITILKICFSCLHFFSFVISDGPHLAYGAFSDHYESILFRVGSGAFEIFTKLAVIVAQ